MRGKQCRGVECPSDEAEPNPTSAEMCGEPALTACETRGKGASIVLPETRSMMSVHCTAPIDRENAAADIRAVSAGQKQDGVGDLLRLSEAL